MPYQGVAVSTDGQQHVPSAVGPMARSLPSLTATTRALVESEMWKSDSQLPPMPWRDRIYEEYTGRPLVIGVMPDDDVVRVHPPIERVFGETCAKLQAAGHELVQWDTSLNAHCIAIMVSCNCWDMMITLTLAGRVLYRRWR